MSGRQARPRGAPYSPGLRPHEDTGSSDTKNWTPALHHTNGHSIRMVLQSFTRLILVSTDRSTLICQANLLPRNRFVVVVEGTCPNSLPGGSRALSLFEISSRPQPTPSPTTSLSATNRPRPLLVISCFKYWLAVRADRACICSRSREDCRHFAAPGVSLDSQQTLLTLQDLSTITHFVLRQNLSIIANTALVSLTVGYKQAGIADTSPLDKLRSA